jgi:peptidyl-prolyl cis-trans isomerase A (cyclophilin A)
VTRVASAVVIAFLSSMAMADDATVRTIMSTDMGDIEIDIFVDRAPISATNFLQLVDGGHLDGGTFYRVVNYANDKGSPKIEVIQGGLNMHAGPFPPIDHETTEQTGVLHTDGVISMARGDVGTATTEFFIVIGEQPALDYAELRNPDKQGFAAFGKVASGMDVVRAINESPADGPSESDDIKGQILTEPVEIISVKRVE